MALPGGILKCEICGMSCVNTIIYDRTCTDMTLYPQLICHVCQDKRKIIWDYLDRIKKKKMKECICFPPKKEPHDKCCTCIQDESRGWKDCPEHGHKYKDKLTTDRTDSGLGYGSNDTPVPQNETYLILSEEERAKGFVRPVRRKYIHLTCGAVTSMPQAIAETYAANPQFYGATYCVHCSMHRPVGPDGEFVWDEPLPPFTSQAKYKEALTQLPKVGT